MKRIVWMMALALSCVWGTSRASGDFPNHGLTIIVPFTPGSGSDASARFYGEELAKHFGQPVVVENRPGGNGIIGIQALQHAPADGYTILLASNSPMSVNPLVLKNLPYDPVRDFRPIAGISRNMNVFLVSVESPLSTIGDLVAAAKKRGPLNVGTYSAGYHLAAEWFANLAGIQLANIPYKGQAPIMTDVIGNRLDAAVVDTGGALTLLKQGKVRALAVSGERRHPELPDVPTVKESGYGDYVQYSWVSFYVHAGTPDAIATRLADAMQAVLHTPASEAFIAQKGSDIMPLTPQAMRDFHLAEIKRFRQVAQAAGIRPE